MNVRRLLVVDDHVAVREGLALMLAHEFAGVEVGFAGTSADALGMAQSRPWDVVIIDLNIPGRGGLETLGDIKRLPHPPPVIVYTVHSEQHFGLKALQAGADGYVTKDSPAADLMSAVRQVVSGRKYISARLAEGLANFVSSGSQGQQDSLSEREQQVLLMLANGRSPTEIATSLSLSIKTVSTYKSRILDKLALRSTADLVRYALEHKLIE